jgi:ribonuclease-3
VAEQVGPDHAPKFRVAARVPGLENGLGLGSSKRAAEQEAARSLLLREGVWTEGDNGGGR